MGVKKFVVAGPPHSGKSVFILGLCENLPRDKRYLFRACPDGEGTWTWKGNGAEQYRQKGKFTEDIVGWYCESLSRCTLAPIILVDIGGRPSEENRRILTEGKVDYGIILAGNIEAVPEWETFMKSCGVEVIAVLHSDYAGKEDSIQQRSPRLEGSVHFLERGDTTIKDRPAVMAVAELILSYLPKEEAMLDFVSGSVLSIPALAIELGKVEQERTLPNGKVVKQIIWTGEDLVQIAAMLHDRSAELPDPTDIDGAAPAWLVSALVHECHPRSVRFNSPDGYVAVGCKRPTADGEGCGWTKTEIGTVGKNRRLVKVEFQLDPSTPLAPAALETITPPACELADVVIMSGRGPNWLVASVTMAYHGRAAAVACFQPGTGATVCWTHVADIPLGHIFDIR